MEKITGIYPALITAFDANDRLDEAAVGRVVEYNLKKGVDGFYVCGSTGESLLMSMDERKRLLESVLEQVAGRARVIAHIGCFHTQDAADLAQHAARAGAFAISSLPPFYYKFTPAELTQYYLSVSKVTDLPMIVYNAPALTGVSFDRNNLAPIFACDRIAGVKFTSYDLYQMQRIISAYPEKTVINGHDEIYLSGLAAGSRCAIGSTFNFMAEIFIRIRELFLQGRMDEAARLQNRANAVIETLLAVGVFRAVKGMLNVLGLNVGDCRAPFAPLTPAEYETLEKTAKLLQEE